MCSEHGDQSYHLAFPLAFRLIPSCTLSPSLPLSPSLSLSPCRLTHSNVSLPRMRTVPMCSFSTLIRRCGGLAHRTPLLDSTLVTASVISPYPPPRVKLYSTLPRRQTAKAVTCGCFELTPVILSSQVGPPLFLLCVHACVCIAVCGC